PTLFLRLAEGTSAVEWHCRFEDRTQVSGHSDGSALHLPAPLPFGYHRLGLAAGAVTAQIELIVAPASCHLPQELQPDSRSWGLTTRRDGLRTVHDLGSGDSHDLT